MSLVGPFQILNGTTPDTGLVSLVNDADLNVVSGGVNFQIVVAGNAAGPNTNYTVLEPMNLGNAGLHSAAPNSWRTTEPIYAPGGTIEIFPSFALGTLQEFQDALEATDYQILAFGAHTSGGSSSVISSITWNGNTHWFLPTPTATVSPASISPTDSSTAGKGITGTFTGFVPGEHVTIYFATGSSGSAVANIVADSDGAVTVTYVADSPLTPGSYVLGAFGESSGVDTSGTFAVAAAALAATGVDSAPFVAPAGILLLLGAGFVVAKVTMRRRAAEQR